MKRFKKGDKVITKYGEGEIIHEDEDSMTVVVQYPNKDLHALPRFEVKKIEQC